MTRATSVSLPHRTVSVVDSGGTGEPVLLAHGFALDSTMFAGLHSGPSALAPARRVIAWDAPGHGGSPVGDTAFTFWDLARDQVALMDVLGIERAVVGGVSQGGFIALRTALVAPERVSALLLLDTEADALSPADAEAYGQLFAALAALGPTAELTTALAGQIVGDHPAADRWAQTWQERGVPLGPPVDCLVGRDDINDRLAEITVPALVARGEHDHSIPAERQERLRAGLARATELHVVPGAGHSPALTHPEQVNQLVTDFLDSLPR
jgi:pimeloyl-ACP methyl ester carboxylesterase